MRTIAGTAFNVRRALLRGGALCLWLAATAALADPPGPPPDWHPPATQAAREPISPGSLCTPDGVHCISRVNYISDVCRTIEATAEEAGLDPHFFARLIWRESLFKSNAFSHAGARGIAQFMPATARRRALDDPFNPAKALRASARFLADLRNYYGNIGLAAAAYNAGESRLEDFIFKDRTLPFETRAYVYAITGFSARLWRDAPPQAWDLRLDPDRPFRTACEELAATRKPGAFRVAHLEGPWSVVVAADENRDIALHRLSRARQQSTLLMDHEVNVAETALPAKHGTQWTARIDAGDRAKADRLCRQLRKSGVGCLVLRN